MLTRVSHNRFYDVHYFSNFWQTSTPFIGMLSGPVQSFTDWSEMDRFWKAEASNEKRVLGANHPQFVIKQAVPFSSRNLLYYCVLAVCVCVSVWKEVSNFYYDLYKCSPTGPATNHLFVPWIATVDEDYFFFSAAYTHSGNWCESRFKRKWKFWKIFNYSEAAQNESEFY